MTPGRLGHPVAHFDLSALVTQALSLFRAITTKTRIALKLTANGGSTST